MNEMGILRVHLGAPAELVDIDAVMAGSSSGGVFVSRGWRLMFTTPKALSPSRSLTEESSSVSRILRTVAWSLLCRRVTTDLDKSNISFLVRLGAAVGILFLIVCRRD